MQDIDTGYMIQDIGCMIEDTGWSGGSGVPGFNSASTGIDVWVVAGGSSGGGGGGGGGSGGSDGDGSGSSAEGE